MGPSYAGIPKNIRSLLKYHIELKLADNLAKTGPFLIIINGEGRDNYPSVVVDEFGEPVCYAVKGVKNYTKNYFKKPKIKAVHHFKYVSVETPESGINTVRFVTLGDLEKLLENNILTVK